MPILNDIMDHKAIGPAIRQGLGQGFEQGYKQGFERGFRQGFEQGRRQREQEILRLLLQKRFGALPACLIARVANLSSSQVDQMAMQLLDNSTLQDLFPE